MNESTGPLVFGREQARRVDAEAIERYGIPGMVLMENAARGLALHAMTMLGWPDADPGGRVAIVCGGGNNGGDGFAAARHLHNHRAEPVILLMRPADSYTEDAASNLRICEAMGLRIIDGSNDPDGAIRDLEEPALWIDALFGTGLSSAVRPPLDDAIAALNDQYVPVLAVDIPSGLDCDTGEPLGGAVKAAATVTFVGLKRGFMRPAAQPYLGQVVVTDIGAPRELVTELGELVSA